MDLLYVFAFGIVCVQYAQSGQYYKYEVVPKYVPKHSPPIQPNSKYYYVPTKPQANSRYYQTKPEKFPYVIQQPRPVPTKKIKFRQQSKPTAHFNQNYHRQTLANQQQQNSVEPHPHIPKIVSSRKPKPTQPTPVTRPPFALPSPSVINFRPSDEEVLFSMGPIRVEGESGPIRTIPAPNLNPADRPAVNFEKNRQNTFRWNKPPIEAVGPTALPISTPPLEVPVYSHEKPLAINYQLDNNVDEQKYQVTEETPDELPKIKNDKPAIYNPAVDPNLPAQHQQKNPNFESNEAIQSVNYNSVTADPTSNQQKHFFPNENTFNTAASEVKGHPKITSGSHEHPDLHLDTNVVLEDGRPQVENSSPKIIITAQNIHQIGQPQNSEQLFHPLSQSQLDLLLQNTRGFDTEVERQNNNINNKQPVELVLPKVEEIAQQIPAQQPSAQQSDTLTAQELFSLLNGFHTAQSLDALSQPQMQQHYLQKAVSPQQNYFNNAYDINSLLLQQQREQETSQNEQNAAALLQNQQQIDENDVKLLQFRNNWLQENSYPQRQNNEQQLLHFREELLKQEKQSEQQNKDLLRREHQNDEQLAKFHAQLLHQQRIQQPRFNEAQNEHVNVKKQNEWQQNENNLLPNSELLNQYLTEDHRDLYDSESAKVSVREKAPQNSLFSSQLKKKENTVVKKDNGNWHQHLTEDIEPESFVPDGNSTTIAENRSTQGRVLGGSTTPSTPEYTAVGRGNNIKSSTASAVLKPYIVEAISLHNHPKFDGNGPKFEGNTTVEIEKSLSIYESSPTQLAKKQQQTEPPSLSFENEEEIVESHFPHPMFMDGHQSEINFDDQR